MNKKTILRGVLFTLVSLGVNACEEPGAKLDASAAKSADINARATEAIANTGNRASRRGGGAQVSDGVFVAPIKEQSNASALLPSKVQTPGAVTIASRDPLTLSQIAERLTVITEIEHNVQLGPNGRGGGSEISSRTLRPNYTGKLSEVLNKVAANFGVEWSFSDGKIILRDYVTRQYQVPVIPSVANGGSTVGEASSGYTADFWTEFEASVEGILGDGVTYSISRSTGLLSVTAQVGAHADIRDYIEEVAANMTQQIAFDVNVLSVSLSETNGSGVDLSAALAFADGQGELGIGNPAELQGGNVNLAIMDGNFDFNAVVNALSRQGDVSIDTRTGVTTVNNRPVPVEVVDSFSYIASYETETDDDTGDETVTPQPETAEVGFMLQLYPRIMNTNEIMVEYSLNLSELQSLEAFGTGDNRVQLPEISSTNFSQQAVLENGHTLILSGFERNRVSVTKQASASTGGIFGIGSSRQAQEERVATVVMIRPRLLRSNRPITSGAN